MRTVLAERRPVDPTLRKSPAPAPDSEPLEGDVVVLDVAERSVVAVQQVLPASAAFDRLRAGLADNMRWENPITDRAMRGEVWKSGGRTSGIFAPHRTFGFVPPQVLRQRYGAMPSRFDREYPELAGILSGFGREAWRITEAAMPTAARAHATAARTLIAPCWHLGGVPWTSGIININNALPYHTDGGNIGGSLSAMLCLRRNVEGGALHLADYDVWLAVPDRSVITFSGRTVLHGVSPLRIRKGGRRFTIVWYTRNAMRVCAPSYEAEVARAQLFAATHDHVPDDLAYVDPELRGRGREGEVVRVRGLGPVYRGRQR